MTEPHPIRIQVGDRLEQAAWVFVPVTDVGPRGVLFCLAGGTYDKRYWHLVIPGQDGYSFAQHMAAKGFLVVAVDHLGVGESDDPLSGPVGLAVLADGDATLIEIVSTRLRNGTLIPGLDAIDVPHIGIGHSMGACLTTMVQAQSHPFEALVLLGYGVDITNVRDDESGDASLGARIEHSERQFRETTGAAAGAHYHVVPREALKSLFYSPSVPSDVIDADTAAESRVPVRAASEVTTAGMVAEYARQVTTPVFLGFGSTLDTSPNPHAEPGNYPASPDVTVVTLADSAHCHNLAVTRVDLWDRIARWIVSVTPDR